MNTQEKTVDKRHLFVSIGCAKYPYQRIKELFGENDQLNIRQMMELPILPDEKVVAIQEMEFFPPTIQLLLALHYCKSTYEEAAPYLLEQELDLARSSIDLIERILLGEQPKETYEPVRAHILKYLEEEIYPLDYEQNKMRTGVFEIILSVLKSEPYQALREASSIQRDLFGEQKADTQLNDMLRFYDHYLV